MTKVAPKIIDLSQTAFIPGKNILDRVVMMQEVLHQLKTQKKKKGIILKLDFEKAYDKVRWRFLAEVLIKKGFPDKWIRWVMQATSGWGGASSYQSEW